MAHELYVTPEQVKASGSMATTSHFDDDYDKAIKAACRGIDAALSRRFFLDDDPKIRYYTTERPSTVVIEDLAEVTEDTEVAVSLYGTGDYTVWTEGTDFVFEPRNALVDGKPYERIVLPRNRWRCLPLGSSVRVTGRFGWLEVPDAIQEYAAILTGKLVRGVRNPEGVVTIGSEVGAVMRIARIDPYFNVLTEGLDRSPVIA